MHSSNPGYPTPDGAKWAPSEVARARHHSYALLSRLYLEGVTPALLPYVEGAGALAEALPNPFDADQAAASHQQLFGFDIFPYEAIFLDSSGLLGGPITIAVAAAYDRAGYDAVASDSGADHVGHELGFLAWLCAKEADALEDGRKEVVQAFHERQQAFLHDHLLRWLPPLAIAVEGQGAPFYAGLAQLTRAIVSEHAASLGGGPFDPPPFPESPALLAREETGLKEIARYLLAPPLSGVYLGRGALERLARTLSLPRGFGVREQLLHNAMRSAVQYDALPQLLVALQEVCEEWEAGYRGLEGVMEAYGAVWAERVEETARVLGTMWGALDAG